MKILCFILGHRFEMVDVFKELEEGKLALKDLDRKVKKIKCRWCGERFI